MINNISILVFQSIILCSYIKLVKKLKHPRRRLINIQNFDYNEFFDCCLFRYLNHEDHHPEEMTKADKGFARKLDFKDIKFPVKFRGIDKIGKKEYHRL